MPIPQLALSSVTSDIYLDTPNSDPGNWSSKIHRKRKKIPRVSRLGKAESQRSEVRGQRSEAKGHEDRISDFGLRKAEAGKEVSQLEKWGLEN